ncbi:uncharacterized protein LOC134527257 isoform X1 [Bacillus rossius redtenbacheri]|uniref:uncharacterized protein LOC134527257 isoform X1 n=1 Tax=Bacillus rossius redtenbacheri TaxID=93214 RepID=UPI002FDE7D44
MGQTRRCVSCSVCVLYLLVSATCVTANDVGCSDRPNCRRCTNSSEGGMQCIKCRNLIVVGSRQCVDQCPAGFTQEWSNLVNYMGRICTGRNFLSLPVHLSAVVVGVVCGLAFCVLALIGGCLYLRHRRKNLAKHSQCYGNSKESYEEDLEFLEKLQFLKYMTTLRCEAPFFLAMLNDTRKQVRDLRRLSSGDSAAQAFRPVLLDLVRILLLLNSPENRIRAPPTDWRDLFSWGERVLRRYKRQNPHQVVQAQLVNFLQTAVTPQPIQLAHLNATEHQYSQQPQLCSFHPSNKTAVNHLTTINNTNHTDCAISDSNLSLQHIAAITFGAYCDDQLKTERVSKMPPQLISSKFPGDHAMPAEWQSTQDCLLEADFITLGFRPQDEVTTEL